jgi:hypothetical protein
MNVADQAVPPRLLTAGRRRTIRGFGRVTFAAVSCHLFLRQALWNPDHRPAAIMLKRAMRKERKALDVAAPEDAIWAEFLGVRDPFRARECLVRILFLGAVPA